MRSRIWPYLFRLLSLVGLAVSSALLVDYTRPIASFCAPGSGCDHVRTSGYGALLGVPVPVFGVVGFALLLLSSLSRRTVLLSRYLGIAAGAAGLGFLALQAFVIGDFCKLCVVVDLASLGIALCATATLGASPTRVTGRATGLWLAAFGLSGVMPILFGLIQPAPPVPPEIARMWVPERINVVEFTDFECPFCRRLHPEMLKVLAAYGDRVHLVRLNMPLASHPHARDAARAYCCADEQGKGESMADALFASEGLSPDDCERVAMSVGVDSARYRKCMAGDAVDRRLDDEMRRVRAAGLKGLPTVWIGERVVVGLQSIDTLQSAFAEAARGAAPLRIPVTWFWAGLSVVLAGLVFASGRIEGAAQAQEARSRAPSA